MRLDTEAAMGNFWLLILTPILAETIAKDSPATLRAKKKALWEALELVVMTR